MPPDHIDPSIEFEQYLIHLKMKSLDIEQSDGMDFNEMIKNSSMEDVEEAQKLKKDFLQELIDNDNELSGTAVSIQYNYECDSPENTIAILQKFIEKYGLTDLVSLMAYILISLWDEINEYTDMSDPVIRKSYHEYMSASSDTRGKIGGLLCGERNDDESIYNFIAGKLKSDKSIVCRPCAIGEDIGQFFLRYPNLSKIIFVDPFFIEGGFLSGVEEEIRSIDNSFTKELVGDEEVKYNFSRNGSPIVLQILVKEMSKKNLAEFPMFNIFEQGRSINLPNGNFSELEEVDFLKEMIEHNLYGKSFIVDPHNHANNKCYRDIASNEGYSLYGLPQHFTLDNLGNIHEGRKPLYKVVVEVDKNMSA